MSTITAPENEIIAVIDGQQVLVLPEYGRPDAPSPNVRAVVFIHDYVYDEVREQVWGFGYRQQGAGAEGD